MDVQQIYEGNTYGKHVQDHAEAVVGDPVVDFCTCLDLCLLMAAGLSDAAMQPLFQAATLAASAAHAAVQKKAYKVLAMLVSQRPAVLRSKVAAVCEVLLDTAAVQTAARRHRLSCIAPLVQLLSSADCPPLTGVKLPEGSEGSPANAVVAALVTELVLSTKEVNAKTRTEAYELLVRVAHVLHEAQPPSLTMNVGTHADSTNRTP